MQGRGQRRFTSPHTNAVYGVGVESMESAVRGKCCLLSGDWDEDVIGVQKTHRIGQLVFVEAGYTVYCSDRLLRVTLDSTWSG